jgi:hypothetical protein
MAAAVDDLGDGIEDPPGATVRDALQAALLQDREVLVTGRKSRFLPSALFESASDDLIAASLAARILGPRRDRPARLRTVVVPGDAAEEVRRRVRAALGSHPGGG